MTTKKHVSHRRFSRRQSGIFTKGYDEAGASLTKRALQGFIPSSGSPNEDILRHASTLRQRSRMLMMASPVATSVIDTYRTKVVGPGLSLKSTVDRDVLGLSAEQAKAIEKQIEAEFSLWASKKENCDALGISNFDAIQQLVIKSWLSSGDNLVLITREPATKMQPYSLRLHVVEADRIRTPEEYGSGIVSVYTKNARIPDGKPGAGHMIYDGIEVDERGKVIAYHISNVYPGEWNGEEIKYTRVKAYGEKTGLPNALFSIISERPDQYRGVPILSSSIETLVQSRRYTESELMAALVQSMFTAWVETGTDQSQIPMNEVGSEEDDTPDDGDFDGENSYEMAPGTVLHLAPGETVKFGSPNIPTAGFESFMKTIFKQIGAGNGLSYEVVMKEFNASYSASRAVLLEVWENIRMYRKWLVGFLCQPVYELFLTEAVALGRIKAPGFFDDPLIRAAWCKASWIGPVQGSIDPKKEIEADILAIQHGIKTHSQVTRERGGDWDSNIEQLKHENKRLFDAQRKPKPTPLE